MAGWEIILAAALLVLFCSAQWLMRSCPARTPASRFLLWIAQGFGIGRIPIAPGTFGSLLGVLWFALLLAPGRLWLLFLGMVLGLGLSVWICGIAEQELGQKDPGSVVLDEITAVPVCFLAVVGFATHTTGLFPNFAFFLSREHWFWVPVIFAAFRIFDVLKPWPVRQSQSFPGGWGITVDDFLAALYVNLLVVLFESGKALVSKS